MDGIGTIVDAALVASMVRLVSPILLAALGGLLTERAGIFNVALEGLMLTGAFAAVVATSRTDDPFIGVGAAVLAAVIVAAIFGFVVIDLKGDAIVAGLAINLLALGATTFLMRAIFGVQGGYYDPAMPGLAPIDVPLLAGIPFVGAVVSGQTALVWVGVAMVAVLQIVLFHHRFGSGCGPSARTPLRRAAWASAYGASSMRRARERRPVRSRGAQLSLGIVTQFVQGMTFGRGFIALVAVMFGRAHPIGVLGASVFFGGAYALALRLQGQGVPSQFVNMLPYLATILVLVAVYGRSAARRRARQAIADGPPEIEAAA